MPSEFAFIYCFAQDMHLRVYNEEGYTRILYNLHEKEICSTSGMNRTFAASPQIKKKIEPHLNPFLALLVGARRVFLKRERCSPLLVRY